MIQGLERVTLNVVSKGELKGIYPQGDIVASRVYFWLTPNRFSHIIHLNDLCWQEIPGNKILDHEGILCVVETHGNGLVWDLAKLWSMLPPKLMRVITNFLKLAPRLTWCSELYFSSPNHSFSTFNSLSLLKCKFSAKNLLLCLLNIAIWIIPRENGSTIISFF